MSELVALYVEGDRASRAVDELTAIGYTPDTIGVVERRRDEDGRPITEEVDGDEIGETEKGVTGGAVAGLAVGAGASLLASAGLLVIPGIGPFLAAGSAAATLTAAAVGAAGGAAVGGAAGAVFGDDDDDVSAYYRDGVAGGKTLVMVHVEPDQVDSVAAVLERTGAERVNLHGELGWAD